LYSNIALRGTLPASYGNMTALAMMDLHNTKLYGSLPAALQAAALAGSVGLGLDATVCSTQPVAMSDYNKDYVYTTTKLVPAGYSLGSVCPLRTCPAGYWSLNGTDTDGSMGGCTPCPAGSTIADLGGVSSPNVTAAHAGAAMCATGTSAVHILAGGQAACAPGFQGSPNLTVSGNWTGCAAVAASTNRTRLILGAVLGSVLGACALAVCALLLRRRADGDADTLSVTGSKGSSGPTWLSDDSSHQSMVVGLEDVVLGDVIGKGGFARVHAAKWNGTAIAAKVFFVEGGLQIKASPGASGGTEPGSSKPGGSFFRGFDSFMGLQQRSRAKGPLDAAFAREMALLAALRHPNICAVYGVVTARSPPWLLMELCGGGSLSALLRRASLQSLTWGDRHAIGVGVACGVDFLHAQQPPVLHRDLKSANVVLSENLVPKICDFGLSSFLPSVAAGAGADTQALGTPMYMVRRAAAHCVIWRTGTHARACSPGAGAAACGYGALRRQHTAGCGRLWPRRGAA